MKRVNIAVGVVGIATAAASGSLATAGIASAAPSCPAPTVLVSPNSDVSPTGTITVRGQNFLCNAPAGATGKLGIGLTVAGSDHTTDVKGTVIVAHDGSFSTQVHLSGLVGWPSSAGKRIAVTTGSLDALVPETNSAGYFTLQGSSAAPTPAPTAVPAGHVDVARNGGQSPWQTGALVLGGVALIAGGAVAVTRRRAAQR